MGIVTFLEKKQKEWLWFSLTFIASLIPVLMRALVYYHCKIPKISGFDIKDVLFAGLAMNLSNLNWVGSKQIMYRVTILTVSSLLILLIGLILGIMLSDDASLTPANNFLFYISFILVFVSTILSYEANNYIFETVTQ